MQLAVYYTWHGERIRDISYDTKNYKCTSSVPKYIMYTVYRLHVSATHVTILRHVHYKGQIHRKITENF